MENSTSSTSGSEPPLRIGPSNKSTTPVTDGVTYCLDRYFRFRQIFSITKSSNNSSTLGTQNILNWEHRNEDCGKYNLEYTKTLWFRIVFLNPLEKTTLIYLQWKGFAATKNNSLALFCSLFIYIHWQLNYHLQPTLIASSFKTWCAICCSCAQSAKKITHNAISV